MNVAQLIKDLSKLDQDCEVVGQYKDSNGTWPMGWVEVAKVPGQNRMVVVQVKTLEKAPSQ